MSDRKALKPQWNEMRLDTPETLQTEIDRLVGGCEQGRGFVRPSGTEDVVRIYAEGTTQAAADALALAMVKAVYEQAGGVGEMQTSI